MRKVTHAANGFSALTSTCRPSTTPAELVIRSVVTSVEKNRALYLYILRGYGCQTDNSTLKFNSKSNANDGYDNDCGYDYDNAYSSGRLSSFAGTTAVAEAPIPSVMERTDEP